jgi:hypothetical protein
MAVTTLQECLDFLGIDSKGIFEINAANDVMVLTSDEGGPVNIDIPDGTYEGAALATALQTAMNADNTLTGTGTITFAVTYSASTLKFTLDATAGKTIAYTHSGSDAGLTLGFSADAAAAQTITSDTAVPADPTDLVVSVRNGVEQDIITGWRDDFASASYVNQCYSGNGTRYLRLRNWPVTAISSVAISTRPVIKIQNSSTDATRAVVNVDVEDQEVRLTVTGGANAGSDTIDISNASYDTLSELVTGINAAGNGWVAEIYDSEFNDMLSSELLEVKGLVVMDIDDPDAHDEYLYTGDPIEAPQVNEDTGMLYLASGWPVGFQNVIVSYTGGYATMRNDLKLAVLRLVKLTYDKIQESGDGMKRLALGGGVSYDYLDEIPMWIQRTLDKYRGILL